MNAVAIKLSRNEFLRSYGGLVAAVWERDDLLDALQSRPAEVLASFGLIVPEGAHIDLLIHEPEDLDENHLPDMQFAMWNQGVESNRFSLVIPLKPAEMDADSILLREEVVMGLGADIPPDLPACCPCCCCETQ